MRVRLLLPAALLLAAVSAGSAGAQGPRAWDGGGADDNWLTTANWADDLLPSGSFDESAVIDNGDTVLIDSDLASSISAPDSPPAGVSVSNGSTLDITGGGAYRTQLLGGGAETGAASFSAGGTLRISGGAALFEAPTVNFAGGVYAPNLTGAAHGLISATGEVNLGGGVLRPSLAFAPAAQQSWVLVDAATINGQFEVDASAAGVSLGQVLRASVQPGGAGQQLVLTYDEVVVLDVDVDTGQVGLRSPAGPIEITGYSISSDNNDLLPGSWDSLESQSEAGWGVAGSPSTARLEELAGPVGPSAQGGLTVGPSARGLGAPYGAELPFQTPAPETLSLEYVTPDGRLVDGVVNYTGLNTVNNLLLTVDPATGEAELKNSSTTTIRLRGYTVLSADGSLKPADGDWNSLEDQGVVGVDEANGASGFLSELVPNPDAPLTLAPGQAYQLGDLFDTAKAQDLELEFVMAQDSLPGDFNSDGAVDAADYTVWRDNLGGLFAPADYQLWVDNYGSVGGGGGSVVTSGVVRYESLPASALASAAPEPAAATLLGLACLGLAPRRRRA